jgi:M6 family metalloprotease-like protein
MDPQVVTQAADQDWDDYRPIPGSRYVDPTIKPSMERFNVALILTDFPGTPFVVTQPEGSTIFGNPGPLARDIPRDDVPAFYVDWLNNPSAINEFQGMNRYWMEDTYGKYGVALQGYGPYELFGTQDEYFLTDFATTRFCNTQTTPAGAQANVTDIEVVSSASFGVGRIVSGFGGGLSRVIVDIPDATHLRTAAATVFSATALAGATNIKVNSVAGLAAGHTIDIGYGDRLESATITNVGTAGGGGTGVDLVAPLTFRHAANTIVRDNVATPISVASDAFITTCGRNYRNETRVAWQDHVEQSEIDSFDNQFFVAAGQDESGTWQEFGEMQFLQNTVPDEWGPPNPEIANNWAQTRYIPWTSWRSAATIWPSAMGNNSIEGEGSGMAVYAHELTHNLGIGDNYNNPYAAPFQRPATGYWSMMSRGSFGGPGGTHTRWNIPSTKGTALGSQHVIRDKIKLGFVTPANYLELNRNGLATSGLVVVDVTAREVDPGASGQTGVRVLLDGATPVDKTTSCGIFTTSLAAPASPGDSVIEFAPLPPPPAPQIQVGNDLTIGTPANGELRRVTAVDPAGVLTLSAPLEGVHAQGETVSNRLNCSGTASFLNYTVEVVDQIGSDSFQADHGVLIEKNKTAENSSCGTFNCFAWVVDAHPEDINIIDFERPDGTFQQVTTGDPRQLTDAAFHAGLSSGSSYEWEDTANGLHFYVIDKHVDDDGVLRYKIAVQNINGAGAHGRGVAVDEAAGQLIHERYTTCTFPLTNTGVAADVGNPHPEDASAYFGDVYRLSVSADGDGWQAQLSNALATAPFGGSVDVPVYVTRDLGSDVNATISLTATSVSDPTKTSTATCATSVQAPTVVVETLDFLGSVPSDGAATNRAIQRAIASLNASLASAYWIDACTLSPTQGKNVFDNQKKAIQELVGITGPESLLPAVQHYLDNLLYAQRQLVVCAIEASEGGNAEMLATAEAELALGDADLAAGLYKEANAHYKTAWDQARKAGG